MRLEWPGIVALGLVMATSAVGQGRDTSQMEQEVIDGDIMYTVLPPDRIPAIQDPVLVSAEEAGEWMQDDEVVIGVIGPGGEARAYSAWHLDHHEIVNDRVGDVPIAVIW
jgi:hypothetical protein